MSVELDRYLRARRFTLDFLFDELNQQVRLKPAAIAAALGVFSGNVGIGADADNFFGTPHKLAISGASEGGILAALHNSTSGPGASVSYRMIGGTPNSSFDWRLTDGDGVPGGSWLLGSAVRRADWVFGGHARMSLTREGDLGVGILNPAARLHVGGDAISNNFWLGRTAGSAGTIGVDGISGPYIAMGGPQSFLSDLMIFGNSVGEAMRIDAQRRLGVGTPNPLAILHVAGDAIRMEGLAPTFTFHDVDAAPQSRFWDIFVNGDMISHRAVNDDYSAAQSYFVAQRDGASITSVSLLTGGQNRLHVAPNGNIGFGTATPATKLHLITSDNVSALFATTSNAIRIVSDTTGGRLEAVDPTGFAEWRPLDLVGSRLSLATNGVERIRVSPLGNIGVGTADPDNFFGVPHKLVLAENSPGAVRMLVHNSASGVDAAVTYRWIGGTGNSFLDIALQDNAGAPYVRHVYGSAVQFTDWVFGSVQRANLTALGVFNVNGPDAFFAKNGHTITPWINIKADFGAVGNQAADDTAALVAAFNLSNLTGAQIYIPPGRYRFTQPLPALTRTGTMIVGAGRRNSVLCADFAAGDAVTMQAQFQGIADTSMEPVTFRTGGYEIRMFAGLCTARNVFVTWGHNGLLVHDASECILENVQLRYMTGSSGLMFSGSAGIGSYGLRIRNLIADNPYMIGVANSMLKGNFAPSSAYIVGDVFLANDWIWQVTGAGTSGASAPAAPGTWDWFVADVANGSLQARAICRTTLTWVVMDGWANSMTIDQAALINGAVGVRMQDTINNGFVSAPKWIFAYDLEIDHPYFAGVSLLRGYGFNLVQGWIGSVLAGCGVLGDQAFSGEISVIGTRIAANGQHGVLMNGCPDFRFHDCEIFDNSINSANAGAYYFPPGTFHDIVVAANSSGFSINDNAFGWQTATKDPAKPYSGFAVVIGANCDDFTVNNNRSRGNVLGNISNASGTGAKRVVNGNAW